MSGAGWIAGRVVATEPAGLRLRNATGEIRIVVERAALPPIGSLVRVMVRSDPQQILHAESLEVVGLPRLRTGETPEWAAPSWQRKRDDLVARDRLLTLLRGCFHAEGFIEVETPTLVRAPGQEPHLLPFRTDLEARGGALPLWLATSPEYAMKRLLAVGFERIFQLGRSYRNGRDEHSPLHAPEFTLVEWYRAWEELAAIGRDVETVLREAALALGGSTQLARGGRSCDVAASAEWLPVAEAFRRHADVELAPYLDGDDAEFLRRLPPRWCRIEGSLRERADSAYFRIMIEAIEPALGVGRPTFLCRYPARHAALSELCADDPRVAQRFEAYVLGIELCNAFFELRDAAEQERRLRAESAERAAAGGEPLPICDDFLRALRSGLPPCAGCALGVDRLHLLVAGAERIDDVLPFPLPPDL